MSKDGKERESCIFPPPILCLFPGVLRQNTHFPTFIFITVQLCRLRGVIMASMRMSSWKVTVQCNMKPVPIHCFWTIWDAARLLYGQRQKKQFAWKNKMTKGTSVSDCTIIVECASYIKIKEGKQNVQIYVLNTGFLWSIRSDRCVMYVWNNQRELFHTHLHIAQHSISHLLDNEDSKIKNNATENVWTYPPND